MKNVSNIRRIRGSLLVSMTTVALLAGGRVYAQDATDVPAGTAQTAGAESHSEGIDEIVVTAQYRSENIQRVPLAISSVSGDDLAAAGVSDLTGLSANVPGLYLSSYSTLSPQLFIRGVGSNDDGITSEGAVGVYLDGVYVGRASSALFDLFDLDRVEVLRGPQGTLYGRNTNGGAIKIVTAQPGPNFNAAVEVGYGSFDQRTLRGLVSGALGDNVYAKLSGSYRGRDGWTRDTATGVRLNDEDSASLRGQLRIEPASGVDATLSLDYSRDRPTSTFKEVVGGTLFGLYQESPDPFVGSYDLPGAFIRRDIAGASVAINWDTGPAVLSVISAYRDTDIHYTEDYDSTPFPVVQLDTRQRAKQFTQELRLVSEEGESSFSWIAGAFYLRDRGRSLDQFILPFFGLDDEITSASTQTSSIAAFGEFSLRVTDRLQLTVGARYTHERKQLAVQRTYRPQDGSPLIDFVPLTDTAISFDNFSPRLVVEYQATEDVLGYASVTRGFKSGGFNNFPANAIAAATAFSPENITAYEVGLKVTAFDRRLRVNSAAFYYDYSDLQVFAPIDTGGALPVIQITNAAKASVKGLEIELTATPVHGVTVELNYAHLLSRYRRFLFNAVDLAGNTLPRAPRDTVTASLEWAGSIAGDTQLRLRGEYVYSSNLFFTPFNDPDLQTGRFGLLNASATLALGGGHWTLSVYGRNLTNKHYLGHGIDAIANFFDLKTGQLAAPRQYGITLGWRY